MCYGDYISIKLLPPYLNGAREGCLGLNLSPTTRTGWGTRSQSPELGPSVSEVTKHDRITFMSQKQHNREMRGRL